MILIYSFLGSDAGVEDIEAIQKCLRKIHV